MSSRYLVVLAASAGGIRAINEILSNLPENFAPPIAIVQHLNPNYPSCLAEILNQHTPLSVKQAQESELLTTGVVYIAPPNLHLVVNSDGTLSLLNTEKVCRVRPAADMLFESAAACFQERVIAVVLTGMDGDGTDGVVAVKRAGGKVIAQDHVTSEFFSMPSNAIQTGCVDFILPLSEIAPILLELTAE
ncbi:CheB methylesterase [Calothrix sp. NIES-4071]|nr:CheB methylesterase [Calothrix sp. NIES-4071]BAZ58552.1 CheB methylesterase [Calothrix sp. NIES-4105]